MQVSGVAQVFGFAKASRAHPVLKTWPLLLQSLGLHWLGDSFKQAYSVSTNSLFITSIILLFKYATNAALDPTAM